LGFEPGNSMMENELQIFGSSFMMRKVIDSLNLQFSYSQEGRIKTSDAYHSCPVYISEVNPIKSAYGKSFKIKTLDNEKFILFQGENDTLLHLFDEPFVYQQS
jgi:hypothetical protein